MPVNRCPLTRSQPRRPRQKPSSRYVPESTPCQYPRHVENNLEDVLDVLEGTNPQIQAAEDEAFQTVKQVAAASILLYLCKLQ